MRPLIIIFLFVSLQAYAQNKVSGILLERGTRAPLKEVNIFIIPHKLKAVTNEKGEFEFNEVPVGEFEFIVNNSGYIRLKQKSSTDQLNVTLYLEKEVYGVFETTVTALAEKKDVTKKTLTQKDFLKAPGAQEDPLKAVQNLPGIANQSVSAQVVIQGSAPDDTRYTLNGHEIPIVFHFGGLSSIIMPQAVEAVDFLASGYGPEYGRALGGIINLQSRPPKTDRWHGMAFVDIYNAGGLAEGPIDETSSIFFSARQSYIGQVLEKIAEDNDDFDLTVAPTFSDIFFDYHKKFGEKNEFSLIGVRSKDELQFVTNKPFNNDPLFRGAFYQRTEFWRFIPRWTHKISGTKSLDFSVGYGDNNIKLEVGDNYFDLDTTTLSQRVEFKHKVSNAYTYYVGVDAQQIDYNVGLKFPQRNSGVNGEVVLTEVEGENQENAIYLRNQFNFMDDKLIFYPNFRLGQFKPTDETYLMPRWSLAYKYANDLTLTFATGLYYQAPQNGEATERVGNPELNSERAVHYTFGIEKDFRAGSSNGFILNLDFFHKRLDQLIIATSDLNADGTNKVNSNEGEGRINGIQTLLKWRYNEFNAVVAYTYLKSLRMEPTRDDYPSEFDQTHNVNLIASYERTRWTYSTRLRYVTGRPFTPVDGAIFDSDNDVYVPINGDFLSDRFSPFLQLDIRFDRKWIYDTWILSAYLDIQNVTNNKNVENISYNFDYSEKIEPSGLPTIPIFGVKGEF